jgi:hypothetical protein
MDKFGGGEVIALPFPTVLRKKLDHGTIICYYAWGAKS